VPVLPQALDVDGLLLEGHELKIVEMGHTDTNDTTVLWLPDIRLVVAGDVVYNETHMYLAESSHDSRREWITSLEAVKALDPLTVIAGHKFPGRADDPMTIDDSISYLSDFIDAESSTSTARELYDAVLARHPRRANPGALWGSAKKIKGAA
jgi:glyoxylase-like metal-dependent hydrolase (beta-lactamase superfamily II)